MRRHLVPAILLALLVTPAVADERKDPRELPPVQRIDESVQAIRAQLQNVQSKLRRGVGDVDKPREGALVKSRQRPAGPVLARCCSLNLEKLAYRGEIIRATIEELTARYRREGNAKGLEATKALSTGMKALDAAILAVGAPSDTEFALEEMSKVRLALDQVAGALDVLKECCPDPE